MKKSLSLLCVLGLMWASCVTSAPPVTVMVGKMPEIVAPSKKEIQLGYGLVGTGDDLIPPELYQLSGAYGIAPRWQLDVGVATINAIKNDAFEVLMGYAGAKYGLLAKNRWSIAVPFGLGAGCGGFNGTEGDDNDDGEDTTYVCKDGFAFGGFSGIDFGYRFGKVVGIYQGNRFQLSKATDLPTSFSDLHVVGLQFDLHKNLFVTFEAGGGWIINSAENGESFGKGSGALGIRW